ncbi:MAG TPA: hypothetical protein VFD45_03675 [Patescibacteria group bacterium]|nr:hypothetical protein [Patescibacteria group bacterium]
MKKYLIVLMLALAVIFVTNPLSFVSAQMMNGLNSNGSKAITADEIAKTKQEESLGKEIYNNLKNKKVSCDSLDDEDFEKLGEYFMGQMAGSSENHVYMDKMMQSRMNADENEYHIAIGKRQSGCYSNNRLKNKGGVYSMMGYGFSDMMGGAYGSSYFGLFHVLIGATVWIVLVLLAVYLYQKIKNPKK